MIVKYLNLFPLTGYPQCAKLNGEIIVNSSKNWIVSNAKNQNPLKRSSQ